MANGKKKKENPKVEVSRRHFMRDMSILMAAAGVGTQTRINFVDELGRLLIPSARADEIEPIRRMIFIGVRSGVPTIGFAAPKALADLSEPLFPNCPFKGSDLVPSENGLYFTPDAQPLMAYAKNIAIAQGIENEGGHTSMFNFWEGGRGQGLTSPIIELADRNTSKAVLAGVHFHQGNANSVEHRTNGMADLMRTQTNTFTDNFKKPSLVLSENSVSKVMEAASKLSRRQALRMTASLESAQQLSTEHGKAAQLMNYDFKEALSLSEMSGEFSTGPGNYQRFGEALAYTLKAMSLNLVNSATVDLLTGDWHGYQSMNGNRTYFQEMSKKLAEAIAFMKSTPDPASLSGETLWDTTCIVIGSEFTRRDQGFGQDNGDGDSQGVVLIGKQIKGGFYGAGEVDMGGNRSVNYSGIDRDTGAPLPMGQRNSPAQLYHTINRMIGARTTDTNQVLHAMLRTKLF